MHFAFAISFFEQTETIDILFWIVIAFSIGIAVGGQPIIGYNYGAGNYKRVFKTYRLIILANVAVGVVGMLWAAPIADVLSIALTVLLISREYKSTKRIG